MFHLSHWYSPYVYGNSPEDDLCLEIISVVLYSTSQSVVSGLRGDPLWSLWGQNYFNYNAKMVQSYNLVSRCWHLHWWCKAMVVKIAGISAWLKAVALNCIRNHCFSHCHALTVKTKPHTHMHTHTQSQFLLRMSLKEQGFILLNPDTWLYSYSMFKKLENVHKAFLLHTEKHNNCLW